MPFLPDIPKAEAAIVEQTNAFRAAEKRQAVRSEPKLAKAARDYASFLAASTLFSHEADGRRPVDRIKAAGYAPCTTAENLAWHSDTRGFETMQLATMNVEGWKGSPGHRKNMLLEHVTETGVAIVKASREQKYFAVQLFARPEAMKYSFQIESTATRDVTYALGGEENRIAPRSIVRHTACLPADVVFTLKPGGILAKAVTSRYEARDGQVFRLTSNASGEIQITVGAK